MRGEGTVDGFVYGIDDVSTRDSFKPALLNSNVGGVLIQNPKFLLVYRTIWHRRAC
jgi:hypothetical protein